MIWQMRGPEKKITLEQRWLDSKIPKRIPESVIWQMRGSEKICRKLSLVGFQISHNNSNGYYIWKGPTKMKKWSWKSKFHQEFQANQNRWEAQKDSINHSLEHDMTNNLVSTLHAPFLQTLQYLVTSLLRFAIVKKVVDLGHLNSFLGRI